MQSPQSVKDEHELKKTRQNFPGLTQGETGATELQAVINSLETSISPARNNFLGSSNSSQDLINLLFIQ